MCHKSRLVAVVIVAVLSIVHSATVSRSRTPSVTTSPVPGAVNAIPVNAVWAFNDGAKSLDSVAWKSLAFANAWGSGVAPLGFGLGAQSTLLKAGAVTYYFRRAVTLPVGGGNGITGFLRVQVNDAAVVYVNGIEVRGTCVRHSFGYVPGK